MTRGSFFVSVGLACGLLAAACGSRGPLDDEAATVDAGQPEAAPDSEEPTPEAGPADASKPVDAGREAGTIIDCGICLVGQCTPAIFTCVSDPSCVSTFQCVVSTCFGGGGGGGGLDPLCLFKCASGASKGALEILQIFQCVTGKCGPDCGQLLQLLTGGFGGGGGGGGGGGFGGGGTKDAGTAFDGGAKMMSAPTPQQSFAEAFSAWPELSRPLVVAPRD